MERIYNKVSSQEVTQFQSVKERFLDNITHNLQERFPLDSTDVVNAFSILSLRSICFKSADEICWVW